ncbi:MAG: hypothetical protein ABIO70_29380 [Pseudomonadota bacterium]
MIPPRRALPLLAALLASGGNTALAAPSRIVLVYGEDLGRALAHIEEQGLPSVRVDAYRLSTLWQGRPPVILGAEARPCQGEPTTNATLRAQSELAESLYFNRDVDSALETIDGAVRGLSCLDRELEESLAARAFFLKGVIHDDIGQAQAARQAFDRARIFDPDLEWDPDFDPRRAAFTDEPRWAGSSEQATLHLGPLPLAHARVSINGLSPQPGVEGVKLPPGEHLVQVLDPEPRTFTLTLAPAQEAWLVVPTERMDELVARLDEPGVRTWLGVLFAAWPLSEPIEEAWLVHGSQSWRFKPPDKWVAAQRPPRPVAEPLLRASGQVLLLGGLGATAAFTVERLRFEQALTTLPERGYWPEAEPQVEDELGRHALAAERGIAIGAGTATLGAGLWLASRWLMPKRNTSLTLAVAPGGVGLALRTELP